VIDKKLTNEVIAPSLEKSKKREKARVDSDERKKYKAANEINDILKTIATAEKLKSYSELLKENEAYLKVKKSGNEMRKRIGADREVEIFREPIGKEKKNKPREEKKVASVENSDVKNPRKVENTEKVQKEAKNISASYPKKENQSHVKRDEGHEMNANIEYKGKGLTIPKTDGDFFISLTRRGSAEEIQLGFKNVSPFLIRKALENDTHNGVESANVQRDGTLTVHCKTAKAAAKVALLSKFDFVRCEAKIHQQLNSSKGVVYCPEFRYLTEEEILDGLQSQGVTAIQRMKKRTPGEIIGKPEYTGLAFLTFNKTQIPTEIKVGYINVEVKEFIPDPMRCYKCLKFGHTKKFCKGDEICGNCAEKSHIDRERVNEKCDRPTKCANCGDSTHNAFSRICPVWRYEKEIQTLKHQKKITFYNARKEVEKRYPDGKSFAQAIQWNQKICKCGGIQQPEVDTRKRKKINKPPAGEGPSGRLPPSGEGPTGRKAPSGGETSKGKRQPGQPRHMKSIGMIGSSGEDEEDMETS
jgi:hypothetical protein